MISSQIAAAIENIRLYKEYSEKERLEHELHLAKEIQLSSLPKPEPQINGLDIYARLSLANDVGWDYYDFLHISDEQKAILIGDVSDKGMPAALFMLRIQGILKSLWHLHAEPVELLVQLNQILYNDLPKNSFFTLSYLLLNLKKNLNLFEQDILQHSCSKQTMVEWKF